MVIKLNNRDILDIEALKKVIMLNQEDFEIEMIQTADEWLQISCENFVISVAKKHKQKIQYYGNLKSNRLYDVIYLYYSNPDNFTIKKEYLNIRIKKQSSKKSLKNLFMAFLISLLLLIIHSILIVMKSTEYGTVFQKLLGYYFDTSITPYQKSLPICVLVFFVFCIIYSIKVVKEKNAKKK